MKPKNFYTFSLVGGAHSGKSYCLSYCEKHLPEHFLNTDGRKITIFFAKEEATKILQNDPSLDNTTLHFQFLVIAGQLEAIHKATQYAESHTDELVIFISDRSTVDGQIYLQPEECGAIGWNYMEGLYDHFFLFDCYINDNVRAGNELRRESSINDLLLLSQKTKDLYIRKYADKISIIKNFSSIEEKGQSFLNSITGKIKEVRI